MNTNPKPKHRSAFTLVELLATVAIITLLVAIAAPALRSARVAAQKARETHAAHQLINAYTMYYTEHDGRLLPGYRQGFPATDRFNNPLGHPVGTRYPYRLAPYLEYNLHDSILVGQRSLQVLDAEVTGIEPTYSISIAPSFGLNATFLGGNQNNFAPYVTKADNVFTPNRMLVFVSSRGGNFDDDIRGYHEVRPPITANFEPTSMPFEFGFNYPKYNNHAVAAHLDGHVDLLSDQQLYQIDRWSDNAARGLNPYQLYPN